MQGIGSEWGRGQQARRSRHVTGAAGSGLQRCKGVGGPGGGAASPGGGPRRIPVPRPGGGGGPLHFCGAHSAVPHSCCSRHTDGRRAPWHGSSMLTGCSYQCSSSSMLTGCNHHHAAFDTASLHAEQGPSPSCCQTPRNLFTALHVECRMQRQPQSHCGDCGSTGNRCPMPGIRCCTACSPGPARPSCRLHPAGRSAAPPPLCAICSVSDEPVISPSTLLLLSHMTDCVAMCNFAVQLD